MHFPVFEAALFLQTSPLRRPVFSESFCCILAIFLWSHTEFKFVLHFSSLITVIVTFLFNFSLLPAINDQHFLLCVDSLKV